MGSKPTTHCTSEVRSVLRRQGGALTLAEIAVKLKRYERKQIMSALSSMKVAGQVRVVPLKHARGGCRQAYQWIKVERAAAPAPKSKCLLSEVWR